MMVIGLALLAVATAAALAMTALEDNIKFFYSPSDISAAAPAPAERIRLGGLVARDSVQREADSLTVRFRVTDNAAAVPVVYTGALPDLFREGQGVVAEGKLGRDGVFAATEILAKHDENYMPPEVADALERSHNQAIGAQPES
jgi:cytochrome c-type biogenesis protein CcmE